MTRRKGPYSQAFKDEAVRMVLDGDRPVSHVARELDIHDTTLHNWVKAWRREHGGVAPAALGKSGEKSGRERELERENRKLREEVAFLKKAAAVRHVRGRQVHGR
ncbi:transposase [Spongiactinospora sp. 9N601]|uniref:transposase n=1 Tax=Spongiactinospora sp. 9N601 TaxID=3375149 RepID=UPI0037AD6728